MFFCFLAKKLKNQFIEMNSSNREENVQREDSSDTVAEPLDANKENDYFLSVFDVARSLVTTRHLNVCIFLKVIYIIITFFITSIMTVE